MKRRDKIHNPALPMIDPKQKNHHTRRRQLSEEILGSTLAGRHLKRSLFLKPLKELSADEDSGFDAEDFISA